MAKYEDGKKPIYKKVWFWILVIVIIGIIGANMGGNETKEVSGNASLSTTPKVEQKTEYNIGEEAILGDGAITVTNIEKSNGNSWDKPKSGKEFVIVSLTIENKGTSNLAYNPFYFKMQNGQGQQETTTFTTIDQDTSLESGELISGGKVTGTLAFEVTKGDENLYLIYNDNLWSSKELKIKLY